MIDAVTAKNLSDRDGTEQFENLIEIANKFSLGNQAFRLRSSVEGAAISVGVSMRQAAREYSQPRIRQNIYIRGVSINSLKN